MFRAAYLLIGYAFIIVALCKSSFYLLRKRRYIALTNLRIAFPEKSQREITKIAKKSYANLGRSIAFNLLILTGRISDEAIHESIESENWNIFKKILKAQKKEPSLLRDILETGN